MAEETEQNGTENQPKKPFKWTKRKEQAAVLLAEDELTDQEIAQRLGIGRTTLFSWKSHAEFTARLAEVSQTIGNVTMRRAIAKKARRVSALNDRWNKLHKVIEERAADPTLADIPGGKTGLIVRQTKGIGKGKTFQVVEEYAVNIGLLKLLNDTERQAAQECGQWLKKSDITTGGEPITLVKGSAR